MSVPSEKFGTHSMMASGFIERRCLDVRMRLERLLPPCIAKGELNAGVDAGVAVSQRGAGDVDGVGAEIERAAWTDEVVDANSALRGEVPDACVGVWAVVLRVIGRAAEGRIFVVGPENTTRCLTPEGEFSGANEVPAKN